MRPAVLLFWLCLIGTGLAAQISGQPMPLKQALSELEETWQAKCVYSFDWIAELEVQRPNEASSFHEALSDLCHQLNLHYEFIQPRVVMLREARLAEGQEKPQEIDLVLELHDENWEGLPFAFVSHTKSDQTWVTDERGQLQFSCAAGSCLEISYLGYEPAHVCFEQDDRRVIQMIPHSYLIPEIELGVDKNVNLGETKAWKGQVYYAGRLKQSGGQIGWSDPLRGLQFLPGISNFDDYSANVQIRGGDYDENMIILDDLPLYNVEHYFGLTSNISGELARDLTLYNEAVPPEYGGRASGVIDISSEDDNNEFAGDVYLSNLLGSARMDIPLARQLDLTVAVRSSLVNLADSDLFTADREAGPGQVFIEEQSTGEETPLATQATPRSDFQDYYLSLKWKLGRTGQLRLNGFYGQDNYDNTVVHSRVYPRLEREVELMRLEDEEDWYNGALGLRWDQSWGDRWTQTSLLNYSSHHYDLGKFFFVRNPLTGRLLNGDRYQNNSAISGWKMSHDWQYQVKEKSCLKFGLETLVENSEFSSVAADSTERYLTNDALTQAFFFSWNSEVDGLQYNIGLRTSYYELTENWYLSPRVLLRYHFFENMYLQASWSLQQQFLREVYFETPTGRSFNYFSLADDRRIPVLEATQVSIGTGIAWRSLSLSVSAYDKYYDGMVEQLASIIGSNNNGGTFFQPAALIFLEGTGRNRGVEFSTNWYPGKWELLSAYTLSKNTVRYDRLMRGESIPAPNDRRHQLNLHLGYRPNAHWNFAAEFSYASGRPFTDVSTVSGGLRDRRNTQDLLRNARLESYQRLDFTAAYSWTGAGGKWQLAGQLFNALDRNNQFYEEYFYSFRNVDEEGLPQNFNLGYEQELLGITPSLSLTYTWD